MATSIEEHLVEVRHGGGDAVSRAERKEEECRVVREILSAYATRDERVEAWTQRTGKPERAFYRRLAEIDNR